MGVLLLAPVIAHSLAFQALPIDRRPARQVAAKAQVDALPTSSLRETPARERERPQRRDVISYIASAFCLLDGFCLAPQAASARERGLQRYIRRKSNQSLDELLPSLLLSRIQLETLVAGALAAENYEVAREALRSGYLARFRFDIRAAASTLENEDDRILAEKVIKSLDELSQEIVAESRKIHGPEETSQVLERVLGELEQLLEQFPAESVQQAEDAVTSFLDVEK